MIITDINKQAMKSFLKLTSPNAFNSPSNLFPSSRRDSLTISSISTRMKELMTRYNAITHIDGKEVQNLRAVDNVLTIFIDIPYRFPISRAQDMFDFIRSGATQHIEIPYRDILNQLGTRDDFFGHQVFERAGLFRDILVALSAGVGEFTTSFFCRHDILAMLDVVGIEVPGWAEINNGGHVSRFFVSKHGDVVSERRSENTRKHINTMDFRERGFREGDTITVNFQELPIGADGRLNIPKGTPVMWGVTFWLPAHAEFHGWRQDEAGNWHSTITHPTRVSSRLRW